MRQLSNTANIGIIQLYILPMYIVINLLYIRYVYKLVNNIGYLLVSHSITIYRIPIAFIYLFT
jgi:hypothetical protein